MYIYMYIFLIKNKQFLIKIISTQSKIGLRKLKAEVESYFLAMLLQYKNPKNTSQLHT